MTSHVTSWKGDIASFRGIKWSRMNENSGSRCEKSSKDAGVFSSSLFCVPAKSIRINFLSL